MPRPTVNVRTFAQQLHPQNRGVELDALLEIQNVEHQTHLGVHTSVFRNFKDMTVGIDYSPILDWKQRHFIFVWVGAGAVGILLKLRIDATLVEGSCVHGTSAVVQLNTKTAHSLSINVS